MVMTRAASVAMHVGLGLAVATGPVLGCASAGSTTGARAAPASRPNVVYATGIPGDADGDLRLTPVECRNHAFAAMQRADENGDRSLGANEVPRHERGLHDAADTSDDGAVSLTELLDLKAREFAFADANGDGAVDADEWSAAAGAELLIVTDSNGNGLVEREELILAMDTTYRRLDTDGDGRLVTVELRRTHLVEFDLDADGTVTRTEWDSSILGAFDDAPRPVRLPR